MKRLALVALSLGCAGAPEALPPVGQVLVYFDTDAPVAPGPGKPLTRDDPAPLFDTLRVEVFEPGETAPCGGCTREFPVDAEQFAARAVSIGIATKPGVFGYRVRASLFLQEWVLPCSTIAEDVKVDIAACASNSTARVPHPATVLERTIHLPPVTSEGIDEITVLLETESVGAPRGSIDAPTDATAGSPSSSHVGTWPGAVRRGCMSAPRADEACVPSGAFWQGNARRVERVSGVASPRLVVLSAFFMKKAEVTVAECRAVEGCDVHASPNATLLGPYWCDYTQMPGDNEALPVNCVVRSGMNAYCEAWGGDLPGGDLPSAAQLEYAGRGTVGTMFVWGNDEPTCDDAMWGRGNENDNHAQGPCYALPRGPYPAGSGERDRLVLPTGTIVDLAGNLSEWARDRTKRPDCQCAWPPGALRDPVCDEGGTDYAASGGAWTYGSLSLALGPPGCAPANFVAAMIGFRCTRPDPCQSLTGTGCTGSVGSTCIASADCEHGFCNGGVCAATPSCGPDFPTGSWMLLDDMAEVGLDPVNVKQYLYVGPGNRWYLSPPTSKSWNWGSFQVLTGSYSYCDGASVDSFLCNGGEDGSFGIGCSSGPGGTLKVLPFGGSAPAVGECTICQDEPNAFGGPVCQPGVAVYYRYVP